MIDNIIEMDVCHICRRPLVLKAPDAVDYNGRMAHAACAAQAVIDAQEIRTIPTRS